MKTIKFGAIVATLSVSGYAARAAADDTFLPNDVRIGSYTVLYHANADNLAGPYVPEGVNLTAENLETLYAAYVRWFTPNLDAELALGYPPLAKVKGSGPQALGSVPYDGQVISSARWISPTLLLEYNFFSPNSALRPYLGAGVNYTTFYDRNSTAAGDAANGGPTKISLAASVSAAFTAGLTYRITERWHLHGSLGFSQVKTHLTTNTDGIERTSNVSFDPLAIIVSIGYNFGH